MFVNYKNKVILSILMSSITSLFACSGVNGIKEFNSYDSTHVDSNNRGSGEYGREIIFQSGSDESNLICDGDRLIINWDERQSNIRLVSCDCNCTSYDNRGWIVFKENNIVRYISLSLGKNIKKSEFNDGIEIIQDIYSAYPICHPISSTLLEKSSFVTLYKYPLNNANSYCFDPVYMVIDHMDVDIFNGKGDRIEKGNSNYYRDDILNDAAIMHIIDTIN